MRAEKNKEKKRRRKMERAKPSELRPPYSTNVARHSIFSHEPTFSNSLSNLSCALQANSKAGQHTSERASERASGHLMAMRGGRPIGLEQTELIVANFCIRKQRSQFVRPTTGCRRRRRHCSSFGTLADGQTGRAALLSNNKQPSGRTKLLLPSLGVLSSGRRKSRGG